MAVFLVGILILSYFLAVKFQAVISNPILQLADVTKIVSENADYSSRVQKMSNDEIGLLYDSFNEMLRRIQEREAERDRATIALQAKTDELSQALLTLQNTQTQLLQAEKMAAIANLVAGVTHEINNPIGAVKSAADVSDRSIKKLIQVLEHSKNIQEARRSNDFQKSLKFLRINNEVITAASQRVSKIIRSLRNFVRLDESDLQIVDIREGLESTLTLIQHEFKEKIEVVKTYDEVPRIVCYVRELNQALMSLLLYSAKTIENSGVIQVSTGTMLRADSNEATQIFVQIKDNGKGIPSEKLPFLFEIGFMANSTRIELGMELSTVQNIIQKHNGTIEVESEVGKGSTFTIKLPVEQTVLYQRSTMEPVAVK